MKPALTIFIYELVLAIGIFAVLNAIYNIESAFVISVIALLYMVYRSHVNP